MTQLLSRVTRRHVLLLCLAYFAIEIGGILAFQLRWKRDVAIFGSFWEAGKHLDYAMHPLVWVTRDGFAELNLNPPTLLPLFQVFALFDPQLGQSLWVLVSATVYLGAALTLREHLSRAQLFWLFTVPLIYNGIGLGQIYVLMFALGVAVWWCLEKDRDALAAVLIGLLVAMKPNFFVWGLLAFAAGHLRPALIAGVVAILICALTAIAYGADIYGQWLAAASLDNHGELPHDVSLIGYFARLGLPGGKIVAGMALIGATGWAYKIRPSLHDLTPVAVIVGMLCSPLAWIDYIMVAAAFIVERRWRLPLALAAFLLYVLPFASKAVRAGPIVVGLVSTVYLATILIMLMHFVRCAARGERRSENLRTQFA